MLSPLRRCGKTQSFDPCLASQEGWCEEYVTTMYRRWFLGHEMPGDPDMLMSVLETLGRNPQDVIDMASSQPNVDRLDAETASAKELGIFGSPTFEVDGELFWGDDRLEDALSWASRKSG